MPDKFFATLKQFLSSSLFLIPAFLITTYVCLFHSGRCCTDVNELVALGLPSTTVQYTQTIPQFFSTKAKPQVLLMGSSLVLSPAHMIEMARHHDSGYACTYFEDGLKERTGKDIKVTNVGVMAGMTCDQYSILKASLAAGKKPSYIIFGMAPRDFTDNMTSIENSPTQQMLAYCRSHEKFFPESLKSSDLELCMNAHKVTFQRIVKHLRNSSLQVACRVSGHPASLADSTAAKPPAPLFRTHKLVLKEDIDKFRRLYNPPNFSRLNAQMAYLNDMMELCHQEQIPVLLVNMPITDDVSKLIDPALLQSFRKNVNEVAVRYHCTFLDLDNKELTAANADLSKSFDDDRDFNDCVHLSLAGGERFFNLLADHLASDNSFSHTFQTSPAKVIAREEHGGTY
ncbi:MAG: hypothetical protein HYX67_04040 [Candidatus Melainabacteria bacterium]|nr:hypothetical protein [Candidatus Melainabacteria bacterium]